MDIKVLLSYTQTMVRVGLRNLLEKENKIRVQEAETGSKVIEEVKQHRHDALILDVKLPDRNGFEVLRHVKTIQPGMPVLMLGNKAEKYNAVRSLRAGASGFLTTNSTLSELISAIYKVNDGGKYVPFSLAEYLVDNLDRSHQKPHELLSEREFQVLIGISSGKSNADMAAEFNLSENTISTYRARVLKKLNLCNNAELIRYALKNNLVE